MALSIHSYPGCCGFGIISGFPGSGTVHDTKIPIGAIREFLKDTLPNSCGYKSGILQHTNGCGYFVTLDQNQRLNLHDLLLEFGFRVVVDASYSKKHFSLITVYFYENFPMTEEEKIKDARDLGGETSRLGVKNARKSFFSVHPEAKERFFGKKSA